MPGLDAFPQVTTDHPRDLAMMDRMSQMATSMPPLHFSMQQQIQATCKSEVVMWCYPEAEKANAVYVSSTNPDEVRAALRYVNACLARNAVSLSAPCFDALLQSVQLPTVPPPVPNGAWYSSTAQPEGYAPRDSFDDSEGDCRHHRGGNRHVRRHNRYHDDDDGSSGVHPIVWMLILPFFCAGEEGHQVRPDVQAPASAAATSAAARDRSREGHSRSACGATERARAIANPGAVLTRCGERLSPDFDVG